MDLVLTPSRGWRPRPLPATNGDQQETSSNPHFTHWVLRLDGDRHKCTDARLFRHPFSPDPIILEDDSIHEPQGTVVLPFKPGPGNRYNMNIGVMTLSNVLYKPSMQKSEISWPVLEKQGFQLTKIRHPRPEIVAAMPTAFRRGAMHVIRHPNLPGAHLLYAAMFDNDRKRLPILSVNVDVSKWSKGIERGVLGKGADLEGTLAWTQASENSRFEEIVLGRRVRRDGINRATGDEDTTFVIC